MDDNGFYVTLPCNASLSVYPENRISSYKTRLASPINLKGKWEVALVEIEYPRSWYSFSDNDGLFILHTAPTPSQAHANKPGEKLFKELSGFTVSRKIQIDGGYYNNLRELTRTINNVLTPSAVLTHDALKNKVYLLARPNIALSFFGKLATILGMKPDDPFGRSAYHQDADFTTSQITYAPHQTDIRAGFYTMYVYTDIIQYQSVGDSYVPLLRCVHITGENNEIVSVRYDKPHYASINKEFITDITIELKDDQNREIPFSYGKVVVKLHFKPVKQSIF